MANEGRTATLNPRSNGASLTWTGGPVYVGYAYHEFKDITFGSAPSTTFATLPKQTANQVFGTTSGSRITAFVTDVVDFNWRVATGQGSTWQEAVGNGVAIGMSPPVLEVVDAVVVEVYLSECGVGQCLRLISEQLARGVRVGCEYEDPQVPFQRDPSLTESELAKLLEVVVDLGRKQSGTTRCEFPQSTLSVAKASNAGGERIVDLP